MERLVLILYKQNGVLTADIGELAFDRLPTKQEKFKFGQEVSLSEDGYIVGGRKNPIGWYLSSAKAISWYKAGRLMEKLQKMLKAERFGIL